MKIVLLILLLEVLAFLFWLASLQRFRTLHLRAHRQRAVVPTGNLRSKTESVPGDSAHWAFINEWHLPGRGDDRPQRISSVTQSGGTPSARRAFARQSHQVKFKKWSKERHD